MAATKSAPTLASDADEVRYRRSPGWRIALSQVQMGQSMTFYILVSYMTYLMNEGYGVAMAVAGVVLSATRIVDGLIDPALAVLIDRFNPRCGKIRFFLVLGWAIRSAAVLVLFSVASGRGLGLPFFVVAYVIYIVGSSINDIAGNIMPPVLTNDPKQRPVVGVWGTVYSYLTPMIVTMVITMVILPRFNNQYSVDMLSLSAVVCIGISAVFVLLCCIGISAVDKPENYEGVRAAEDNAQISARDMWHLIRDNRPFQMYILSSVAAQLAQQTRSQAIISTMLWGILVGNIQFGTMLSVISMLPSIVFAVIGAKHAGRVGNKRATVVWSVATAAAFAVLAGFFAAIDMRGVATNAVLLVVTFVLVLVTSGTQMCVTTANTAMRSDVVDYELARSGNFMAGTVSATYNFINQIITSLGTTIATVCVAAIGYVTTSPQPTDAPTPEIKFMTIFLFCVVPMIGALVGLFAMKFYRLGADEMKGVQLTIQRKREKLHHAEGADAACQEMADAMAVLDNPVVTDASIARSAARSIRGDE